MTKFYSKTTGGFYSQDVHVTMPNDVVELTDEAWIALLEGQATGKVITADESGKPVLTDPPPAEPQPEKTPAEKLANLGLTTDDLKALLGL